MDYSAGEGGDGDDSPHDLPSQEHISKDEGSKATPSTGNNTHHQETQQETHLNELVSETQHNAEALGKFTKSQMEVLETAVKMQKQALEMANMAHEMIVNQNTAKGSNKESVVEQAQHLAAIRQEAEEQLAEVQSRTATTRDDLQSFLLSDTQTI